jgi:peroxidase
LYRKTCPKACGASCRTPCVGLLRLHFHDCFVQGCDASVLLDGSASGPPNLTLRPTAINDIHDALQKECGAAVVSCSDVLDRARRPGLRRRGA